MDILFKGLLICNRKKTRYPSNCFRKIDLAQAQSRLYSILRVSDGKFS